MCCVKVVMLHCKQLIHLWLVLLKSFNNVIYFPHKDACIPQEVTAGDKCFCQFQIRLFGKCFYLKYIGCYTLSLMLYITIPCVWVSRLNAQCYKCMMLIGECKPFLRDPFKLVGVHHQVIGWCNNKRSIRISLLQLESHISNAGCSVLAAGLGNNILYRDL